MAHVIKNTDASHVKNDGKESTAPNVIVDDNSSELAMFDHVPAANTVIDQMPSYNYQSQIDELETANHALVKDKEMIEHEVNNLRAKLEMYKKDFEENKQNGFDVGKEQGFSSGLKEADECTRDYIAQLQQLYAAINEELKNEMLENKDHIKDVILSALIKLITATPSEEVVMSELDKLIKNMSIENKINVHMSKKDYENLNNSEYSQQLPSCITFILDDKILPGGIIVQSKSESVDARLERKLELFKEQLASA